MPVIELATIIAAPVERVFDLARSIDLHIASTAHTAERAVAGVTSGMLGPGEEVTWRAKHLGVWWQLTSRMTAYDRPRHFRDSMVRGVFRRLDHDHYFEAADAHGGTTSMRDVFDFASPFGPLGALADRLFLMAYLRRLLRRRNQTIRKVAETELWRAYL